MTLFAGAPLRTIEFVMVEADASFPGGTERCVSAEGEERSSVRCWQPSQGFGRVGGMCPTDRGC